MKIINKIGIVLLLLMISLHGLSCSNELATYTINGVQKRIIKQDVIQVVRENSDIYYLKNNIDAQQRLVTELALHDIFASIAKSNNLHKSKWFGASQEILKLWHMQKQYTRHLLIAKFKKQYDNYTEETVDVNNIFLHIRPQKKDTNPLDKNQAYAQTLAIAQQAIKEIQDGAKFANIAMKYSDGISKYNAGNMGFVLQSQLVKMDPIFAEYAYKLNPGKLSDPVKSEKLNAFHIILISDKKKIRFADIDQLPGSEGRKVELHTIMEENMVKKIIPEILHQWQPQLDPQLMQSSPDTVILKIQNKNILTKNKFMELYSAFNNMRLSVQDEKQRNKKLQDLQNDPGELRDFAIFIKEAYTLLFDAKTNNYTKSENYRTSLLRESNKIIAEKYLHHLKMKKPIITEDELKIEYNRNKKNNKNFPSFEELKSKIQSDLDNRKRIEFIHSIKKQKLTESHFRLLKNNFSKFSIK